MTTHQQVHPAYALVMLTGRGIGRENWSCELQIEPGNGNTIVVNAMD